MNLLSTLLFESPRTLAALLGLGLFFLLVHWRRSLNARPLLVGLAVAATLLVVERAVVTHAETAAIVMSSIERDLLLGQADALDRAIVGRFRAGPMDRSEFLEFVAVKLREVKIVTLNRMGLEIADGSSDRFSANLSYLANISVHDYKGFVRTRWRIEFTRDAGEWRILRIDPTHLENTPLAGWATYGGPP